MKKYHNFFICPSINLLWFQSYIVGIIFTVILITTVTQAKISKDERKYFPMLMPNVQPLLKDTYLCTAFRMPKNDFEYIVEISPNATMPVGHHHHHIIIHGCETPGLWKRDTPGFVWECGEIEGRKSKYLQGPTCKSGSQILYVWAKGAPKFQLPEGVGFKVGKDTGINFLVLKMHYARVEEFIAGGTDDSGVVLTMLPSNSDKVSKLAGVLVLGAGGMIKTKEKEHFESACRIEEPLQLHPFAFRTHTHKLGIVVSGYKIGKDGKWKLIGKHNPQDPQMFYPVEDENLIIELGDIVASRCTMYNYGDKDIYIGKSNDDEMCNFYMMYYVDGDNPMQKKFCFTAGPKSYYWEKDSNISYVPRDVDFSASLLNA